MIKLLALVNGVILISHIEEVGSEIGEPDCKLTNPYVVNKDESMEPFLYEYTLQNVFMIHSDKIFTITDPKATLLEKYEKLTK
jgi:hypothetical protein